MENVMTTKDVLTDVSKMLSEITIPVTQVQNIGIPIARALDGIRICIEAMEKAEKEQAEKEAEKADEPKLELVKAE